MNDDPAIASAAESRGRQLSVFQPPVVMAKRSLVTRALNRVVPEKSKFLGFTWLLAVAGVFLLFGNIQGEATQFYGIAESQQQSISFQYPVEIVEIPVVVGERVDADSRLLEVRRYDLTVNLAVFDEKINEARAEQSATRHNVSAEIATLKAERVAQLEAYSTKIRSLEARHQLNQAQAELISGDNGSAPENSPMLTQIRGLKAEKAQTGQMFEARIDLQKQKLRDSVGPSQARVAELEKQKDELLRQSKALVVAAPFAGSIGSIMFKPGEQVDAFNPVISIQGTRTRHIKGYIHEAVSNNIQVGQTVWIKPLSAATDDGLILGTVESLGSQIVEYPQRLKRSPLVAAWGREAVINVAPHNAILLGEKVSVLLSKPESPVHTVLAMLEDYIPISAVRAWTRDNGNRKFDTPADIKVQLDSLKAEQIEASGIVWNPISQSYLLVSDEQPMLFEFSPQEGIRREFALSSIGPIGDIESISRDGDYYYLAASLSHNRAHKLKPKRRQLMRVEIDQTGVRGGTSVDLYAVLTKLAQDPRQDTKLVKFIRSGIDERSLDIEAHAVIDGNLYLGFKAPLDQQGNTVIVKINNLDAVFKQESFDASLWLQLNLEDAIPGKPNRLSGLVIRGSTMYLLTVGKTETRPISHLWQFDYTQRRLTRLSSFAGLRAEGISLEANGRIATIVFDGAGKSPSRYLQTRL